MPQDDFGLSELTDDQVVDLAQALALEISKRDPSVYDASRAAIAAATRDATASQAVEWGRKAAIAEPLHTLTGGDGDAYLNVWLARDRTETRVYIEAGRVKMVLHVTGGKKAAPGTWEVAYGGQSCSETVSDGWKALAEQAAAWFPGGERIQAQAPGTYATPAALPDPVKARVAAITAKVDAERAREKFEWETRRTLFAEWRDAYAKLADMRRSHREAATEWKAGLEKAGNDAAREAAVAAGLPPEAVVDYRVRDAVRKRRAEDALAARDAAAKVDFADAPAARDALIALVAGTPAETGVRLALMNADQFKLETALRTVGDATTLAIKEGRLDERVAALVRKDGPAVIAAKAEENAAIDAEVAELMKPIGAARLAAADAYLAATPEPDDDAMEAQITAAKEGVASLQAKADAAMKEAMAAYDAEHGAAS